MDAARGRQARDRATAARLPRRSTPPRCPARCSSYATEHLDPEQRAHYRAHAVTLRAPCFARNSRRRAVNRSGCSTLGRCAESGMCTPSAPGDAARSADRSRLRESVSSWSPTTTSAGTATSPSRRHGGRLERLVERRRSPSARRPTFSSIARARNSGVDVVDIARRARGPSTAPRCGPAPRVPGLARPLHLGDHLAFARRGVAECWPARDRADRDQPGHAIRVLERRVERDAAAARAADERRALDARRRRGSAIRSSRSANSSSSPGDSPNPRVSYRTTKWSCGEVSELRVPHDAGRDAGVDEQHSRIATGLRRRRS